MNPVEQNLWKKIDREYLKLLQINAEAKVRQEREDALIELAIKNNNLNENKNAAPL